jgi:hypothetical protein
MLQLTFIVRLTQHLSDIVAHNIIPTKMGRSQTYPVQLDTRSTHVPGSMYISGSKSQPDSRQSPTCYLIKVPFMFSRLIWHLLFVS